jgi:hypothetical protein
MPPMLDDEEQTPPETDPIQPDPDPITDDRDLTKQPKWVQDLVAKQNKVLSDLKDENAKRRIAAKEAEIKKLEEDGEWEKLAKERGDRLAALEQEIADGRRLSLARRVSTEVLGALVDDHEEFAQLLNGETEEELRAHATRLKGSMSKKILPNTEGNNGRGRPAVPPTISPEQIGESLKKQGTYYGM